MPHPAFSAVMDLQEGFDEVMKEYPQMSKAMDLVAEHRIRALHKSRPWLKEQQDHAAAESASDAKRLDHALEVSRTLSQKSTTLPHDKVVCPLRANFHPLPISEGIKYYTCCSTLSRLPTCPILQTFKSSQRQLLKSE